jgi:hypothetical protein
VVPLTAFGNERCLQGCVALGLAKVGSEVVAEVEEVDPHRGAVFDRVHKEAPWDAVAFAETC